MRGTLGRNRLAEALEVWLAEALEVWLAEALEVCLAEALEVWLAVEVSAVVDHGRRGAGAALRCVPAPAPGRYRSSRARACTPGVQEAARLHAVARRQDGRSFF